MKRRVIVMAVFVATGALTFLILRGASGPPEPVYKGKTLSEWLSIWGPIKTNLIPEDSINCQTAVRGIGSNAVPFLLKMLDTPDSAWKQRLVDLARKQKFVAVNYVKPSDLRLRGQMGLSMLGPEAKSAVPELIRMYGAGPMPNANLANLLGQIGPPAKPAIPKLLADIPAGTNDFEIGFAIQALGKIRADASNVVPVLAACLTNKSKLVQTAAAIALGEYESNAKAAVPALVKLAEEQPPTNYTGSYPQFLMSEPGAAAKDALSRIDKEAYENFTRSLR